jgi:UDP-N-acetylglucosamine 2-epimerase (non-hydrolysing)
LVLRRETERPEAAEAVVVKLVGADFENLFSQASRLLDDDSAYQTMAKWGSPYGDGHASDWIVPVLGEHFDA